MGKKSANAEKKLPPLKPILALPTWGQMWILSELWVLEKGNFDLGHPVQFIVCIQKKKFLLREYFTIRRSTVLLEQITA